VDANTQAIATEIASQVNAGRWFYLTMFLVLSILGSFLGAYAKKKGENKAMREEFQEVKDQLATNTRVTEEIKAEIGHAEWKAREVNALLRAKLEEFAQCIASSDQGFSTHVRKSCGGEYVAVDIPELDRLRALAALYFPEFLPIVGLYTADANGTMIWAMERAIAVSAAKQGKDVDKHAAEMRLNIEEYKTKIPEHQRLRDKLEEMAAERMKSLLE